MKINISLNYLYNSFYSPITIIPNFSQYKFGKTKMAREVKVTRNFC